LTETCNLKFIPDFFFGLLFCFSFFVDATTFFTTALATTVVCAGDMDLDLVSLLMSWCVGGAAAGADSVALALPLLLLLVDCLRANRDAAFASDRLLADLELKILQMFQIRI
jgi:hypothetical protein